MTPNDRTLPFASIVGQDDLKLALILNAISPFVGGVLIEGDRGNAKSSMARALANLLPLVWAHDSCRYCCDPSDPFPFCRADHRDPNLLNRRRPLLVELPLGAGEDRVLGHLDLEGVLRDGERKFEPGILAKAHRGVLYVDEVNLLDDQLVDMILDAAASGVARVERDGFSFTYPAHFILVGTMNPEEGELRPQLLDRFGLSVQVETPQDPQIRTTIVQRRLTFNRDPREFIANWQEREEAIQARIQQAREGLDGVLISDSLLTAIAELCIEAGVEGLRADIVMAEASRAHAAYQGRTEVNEDDIFTVAPLVLAHRRQSRPDPSSPGGSPPPKSDSPSGSAGNASRPTGNRGSKPDTDRVISREQGSSPSHLFKNGTRVMARYLARDHVAPGKAREATMLHSRVGVTRRSLAWDGGLLHRIAWPETITREILLHRKDSTGNARIHRDSVVREMRRFKRQALYVFLVDSSASMAGYRRMAKTKGMIVDAVHTLYKKRARFAVIAFRKDRAEVLLAPTRKPEKVQEALDRLPTGGNTPLATGLRFTFGKIRLWTGKRPDLLVRTVICSDGRVAELQEENPAGGSLQQWGKRFAAKTIFLTVVDTEWGRIRLGTAKRLALQLGAQYLPQEQLG